MSELRVDGLSVSYRVRHQGRHVRLHAVDDVSFELARGETLGLVGESGSGKSTIARALLRLIPADAGTAMFRGTDLLQLSGGPLREMRRHLQLIFQDPLASLDPRMSVEQIITEPLQVHARDLTASGRRARALEVMQRVGLAERHLHRFPHEFSGGQAQRIGIARALIASPQLIVCDEPLAALDASIKSQISNLLRDLQQQMQLSLLFISHDLSSIRFNCDRVMVLYLGRVMEIAARDALFEQPRHPYTRALIQAIPQPDPSLRPAQTSPSVPGEIPSPLNPPSGCVFRTRCPLAIARCTGEVPPLRRIGDSLVACHRADEAQSL